LKAAARLGGRQDPAAINDVVIDWERKDLRAILLDDERA
jgi:hypothetical protein